MRRPPAGAPLREIGPWVPPSPARVAAVIAGIALAVAGLALGAGWWAGGAARDGDPAAAPRGLVAEVGAVRVRALPGWMPDEAPEAAALPPETAVFAVDPSRDARAIVTLAPATDATLLPAALRERLARAPRSHAPTRLAGRPAWRYERLPMRSGRVLDATLLPTTAGVLAVACVRPRSEAGCGGTPPGLELGSTAVLAPAADLVLRRRLPAAIERLDRRRVPLRRALRAAPTRRAQARVAGRLAAAHARTRSRLAPVAPARSGVLAALQRADVGYRRLARAALRGRRGGFARARGRVRAAERTLARALRSRP
jgi:hypothetical protein